MHEVLCYDRSFRGWRGRGGGGGYYCMLMKVHGHRYPVIRTVRRKEAIVRTQGGDHYCQRNVHHGVEYFRNLE